LEFVLGDWITVKKVTRNPVFVTAGQTLKLRLDIENVDKWNTTAFWVYAKDSSETSREHDLQLVRDVDSSSETYFSYNKTRVSRERQVDLVVSSMTLADSGVYRCKFRKRDEGWSIRVEYNVIVEGKIKKLTLFILDNSISSKLLLEAQLESSLIGPVYDHKMEPELS
jgi:hypothetical protein